MRASPIFLFAAAALCACASGGPPPAAPTLTLQPTGEIQADSGSRLGRLADSRLRLEDGRRYEEYVVSTRRGTRLRVTASTPGLGRDRAWVPLVILRDSTGREIGRGDTSRLREFQALFPDGGTHRLQVAASGRGLRGDAAYRLHWWWEPLGGGGGDLELGRTHDDTIGVLDRQPSAIAAWHTWRLQGEVGRALAVEAVSPEFRVRATLRDPDGREVASTGADGPGRAARLTFTPWTSRPFEVRIATGAGPHIGRYWVRADTAPAGAGGGSLADDALASGELGPSDLRAGLASGGPPADLWYVDGAVGRTVRFEMTSAAVHSQLVLRDSTGRELARSGVLASPSGAELVTTFPASGRYQLLAGGGHAADRGGAYTLRVTTPQGVAGGGLLTVGRTVEGKLGPEDGRLAADERPFDVWLLEGAAGQVVRFRVSSPDLAPGIRLQTLDGAVLASWDPGSSAEMRTILPAAGRYVVNVFALEPTTRANYRIQWREPPIAVQGGDRGGELVMDGEADALVTEEDTPFEMGRGDVWRFSGTAGQAVELRMSSTAFNPFLVLQDPSGAELARAGGIDVAATRVRMRLPRAGAYRATATAYGGNQRGAYAISLAAPEDTLGLRPDTAVFTQGLVGPVRRGDVVTGRLTRDDPVLADGSAFQAYRFEGRAGETITLEVRSSDFDAYAIVQDRTGKMLARDDDSGTEMNARLTLRLPYTGAYRLLANSYRSGNYGTYQVLLR